MVKVLLFPLFEQVKILPLSENEEPQEIATAGDAFLVATRDGTIKVFSGSHDHTLIHQFRTVNTCIVCLLYVPTLDAIVTLEKETETSAITVARIYQNWRVGTIAYSAGSSQVVALPISSSASSPQSTSPPSPRRSGNTTPAFFIEAATSATRSAETSPHYAGPAVPPVAMMASALATPFVRTLPASASVTAIAACPLTGRIAMATERTLTVFATAPTRGNASLTSAPPPASIEWMCETDIPPGVRHLGILDNYIAYTSKTDVKVLRLDIAQVRDTAGASQSGDAAAAEGSDRPLSEAPFEPTDDEHFIECVFDVSPLGESASGSAAESRGGRRKRPMGPSFDLRLPSIISEQGAKERSFELFGPTPDIDHDLRVNREAGYVLRASTLLLHRRFKADTPITALQVIPTYSDAGHLCWIGAGRHGYIYDLDRALPVEEYAFTSEPVSSCAGPFFVYALTAANLETWTIRGIADVPPPAVLPGYAADTPGAAERGEYGLPSPCLIGMQQLMSLHKIAVAPDFAVLLTKVLPAATATRGRSGSVPAAEGRPAWNVYILHPTPLAALVDEITRTANENAASNPAVYRQLLVEAHILLEARVALLERQLRQLQALLAPADPSASTRPRLATAFGSELELDKLLGTAAPRQPSLLYETLRQEHAGYSRLLRLSSRRLAEHYLASAAFSAAAVLFAMSDVPIKAVYDAFRAHFGRVPLSASRHARTRPPVDDVDAEVAEFEANMMTGGRAQLQGSGRSAAPSSRRPAVARVSSATPEVALIEYLEKVVYDSAPQHDESQPRLEGLDTAVADGLLELYARAAPSRLSHLVLHSWLASFLSLDKTLKFLENRLSDQTNAPAKVPPRKPQTDVDAAGSHVTALAAGDKDAFARGLLYLDLGRLDDATSAFLSLNAEGLLMLCLDIPSLMDADRERYAASTDDTNAADHYLALLPATVRAQLGLAHGSECKPTGGEEAGIPSFCTLLINCTPWLVLELLYRLTMRGSFPIRTALNLLSSAPVSVTAGGSHGDVSLAEEERRVMAEAFLEAVVLAGRCDESASFGQLVCCLAGMYLARLLALPAPVAFAAAAAGRRRRSLGIPMSFASRWRAFHREALTSSAAPIAGDTVGGRGGNATPCDTRTQPFHQWLEGLPPLCDMIAVAAARKRGGVSTASPMTTMRSFGTLCEDADTWDGATAEERALFRSGFYVRKLQGLFCLVFEEYRSAIQSQISPMAAAAEAGVYTPPVRPPRENEWRAVSSRLLELVHTPSTSWPGKSAVSLMGLLCHGRFAEAVEGVIGSYPHVLLEFSKQYCRTPADWSVVLDRLLAGLSTPSASPDVRQRRRDMYGKLLDHLSGQLDPDQFLPLLPDRGNMAFFLHYIERTFSRYCSRQIRANILAETLQEEIKARST